MATIGHLAIGAAIARICASPRESWHTRLRRTLAAAFLATAPDADLLLRAVGVKAGDAPLAHRGASHALIIGPCMTVGAWLAGAAMRDALCYGLSVMSHGPVDCLSESERGAALLWPISAHRFSAPYRPVLARALTRSAIEWRPWARVMLRELLLFSPAIATALWPGPRAAYGSSSGSSSRTGGNGA